MILLVAAGVVAIGVSLPKQDIAEATTRPARATLPVPIQPNALDLGTSVGNPQPWEYDAANDRHWDPSPGHQHWHPGPPPADTGATAQPWEYDAANDRHWDPSPGHQHWHPGPPPVDTGATRGTSETPARATTQPWEYDAASDRHWDPVHGHWHPGQPPPPDQR